MGQCHDTGVHELSRSLSDPGAPGVSSFHLPRDEDFKLVPFARIAVPLGHTPVGLVVVAIRNDKLLDLNLKYTKPNQTKRQRRAREERRERRETIRQTNVTKMTS